MPTPSTTLSGQDRIPRPLTAIISVPQWQVVSSILGDDLTGDFAAPKTLAATEPMGHRSSLRPPGIPMVHIDTDAHGAAAFCHQVQRWLIEHPDEVDLDPTLDDLRRLRNRRAANLMAVARRVEVQGRIPLAVSARLARMIALDLPAGLRLAYRRAGWAMGATEISAAWIVRHREVLRFCEGSPQGYTGRRSFLRAGLTVRGTTTAVVPQWWMLLAPTATNVLLPAPGEDPYDAAVRYLTAARTTARVERLATDYEGPARWARSWAWSFLATCTTPWDTIIADPVARSADDRLRRSAVEQAWYDVAAHGDPFDGAPVSPTIILEMAPEPTAGPIDFDGPAPSARRTERSI